MDDPRLPDRMSSGIQEVWSRLRHLVDARLETIARAAAALGDGGLEPGLRRDAERQAHKLAGSLGIFGFHEGSRLAREAEVLLADDALDGAAAARLLAILEALRRHLAADPGP